MKNSPIPPQRLNLLFGLIFFLSLLSYDSFAQVGIGTTMPNANAKLDITSTAAEPGGLLLPRLALTAINNVAPLLGPAADLEGMTVYNTVTAGTGVNQVTPGFYYHDGATWVRIGAVSTGPNTNWLVTGNAGTSAGTNFLGTTDNQAFIISTNSAEKMRFLPNGQIYSNRNTQIIDTRDRFFVYGNTNETAVRGYSYGDQGKGIWGESQGTGRGVQGSNSGTGEGVIGFGSPGGTGVWGQNSSTGDGVVGFSGSSNGVYGAATSAGGRGGNFLNTQTNGFGLWALGGGGLSYSFPNSGAGASITGRLYGATSIATGVNALGLAGIGDNLGGIPARPLGVGVLGYGYQAGVFGDSGYYSQIGVQGRAEGTPLLTSNGVGVYGENIGNLGFGVAGESSNIGVYGAGAHGSIFEAEVNGGFGAIITNVANSGADRVGLTVAGQNLGIASFAGTGAVFTGTLRAGAGFAVNANGTGLVGVGNNITTVSLAANGSGVAGTGLRLGVYGKANRPADGIGVVGLGNNGGTYTIPSVGAGVAGTGVDVGIFGHSTSATGWGVYSSGDLHSTANITASGNISATGDVTAGGVKNFIIDDPRDPANKYLKHASIESDEILNLYRGVSTFDASGEVVVQLPDYYDAINKNASYQLTPVGASMPNLYIATKVNNGIFVIAGGIAGKEVSWTITAERNDAYIRNNPEIRNMVVDKGVYRGRYLAPEAYGKPADFGIFNNGEGEIRSALTPIIGKQAIVIQEMKSEIEESTKLNLEEVQNLTTPFKKRRTVGSATKEIRDVTLDKAEKMEVTFKSLTLEGQNNTDSEIQNSQNAQQTVEIKDNN